MKWRTGLSQCHLYFLLKHRAAETFKTKLSFFAFLSSTYQLFSDAYILDRLFYCKRWYIMHGLIVQFLKMNNWTWRQPKILPWLFLQCHPPPSPATFVELLPMVSLPSLYGMEGTIFLRIFLALAQRVAHHQIWELCIAMLCWTQLRPKIWFMRRPGGEIICMIGSPRPPMYSPPPTWGGATAPNVSSAK